MMSKDKLFEAIDAYWNEIRRIREIDKAITSLNDLLLSTQKEIDILRDERTILDVRRDLFGNLIKAIKEYKEGSEG